ncbi:MAG: cytochrome c biogenesis CcdA family protein [Sciscionella sp.]
MPVASGHLPLLSIEDVQITALATSGPLLLACLLAVLAGAVSFASPCVVPLVPGYLAYMAGLVGAAPPAVSATELSERSAAELSERSAAELSERSAAELSERSAAELSERSRMRLRTRRGARVLRGDNRVGLAALLFVLGFTVVFTLGTVALFGVTSALAVNAELLQRIGGVITIVLALVFLGFVPLLQRELRPHPRRRTGLIGAPLLGGTFALGWTPCIGPTLAGVIALSTASQFGPQLLRGVLLMLLFCLGLGVPFVLIALGARWAVRATGWLRAHTRGVQIFGGVLLLVVGVALVTGAWTDFVYWLRDTLAIGATSSPI